MISSGFFYRYIQCLFFLRGFGQLSSFVGNRVEEVGYGVSLAPGMQEVGVPLIGIGKGVSLTRDVVNIGVDLLEHKYRDGCY